MAYRLRCDREFLKQLEKLPGDVRTIGRRAVRELAECPRPLRAKELEGHAGYYRLWLSHDHRLVWEVLDEEQVVDLIYIGPKLPDLYERLGLGRPVT